jgi:hypothetical protein
VPEYPTDLARILGMTALVPGDIGFEVSTWLPPGGRWQASIPRTRVRGLHLPVSNEATASDYAAERGLQIQSSTWNSAAMPRKACGVPSPRSGGPSVAPAIASSTTAGSAP